MADVGILIEGCYSPMVFYGVVGAAREVLGNCSPLVAQLPVLFADELLLHAQIEYATSKLVTSLRALTCVLASLALAS